jgi:hypothetical protein
MRCLGAGEARGDYAIPAWGPGPATASAQNNCAVRSAQCAVAWWAPPPTSHKGGLKNAAKSQINTRHTTRHTTHDSRHTGTHGHLPHTAAPPPLPLPPPPWEQPGPATRSRAANGPPKARHEAGYRSRICLNGRQIRTELEKRVLYAL